MSATSITEPSLNHTDIVTTKC